MISVRVLVSGRVQGVGYRAWVSHHAQRLGLCGWVRNLADGQVEALLQGETASITQLCEAMHKGPFLARVDTVYTSPIATPTLGTFEVRR